jgi:SM-20-related protein
MSLLDLNAIAGGEVRTEPYRYFYGAGFLRPEAITPISSDFPKLDNAGFLTLDRVPAAGSFSQFLEELQSQPLSAAVSEALAFNLVGLPQLVTVMRWCPRRAGRIHTDGASKLATMLVYLNPTWTGGSNGAIRALRSASDVNAYAEEVLPHMGNIFGFLRSECSWHGHLPFEGERRVVQITWLDSEEAVTRKQRNNRFAQALKSLWPSTRSTG